MNPEKKTEKTLNGVLLRPLAVGAKAVILHQGQVTLTSRVVAIHSYGPDTIYCGRYLSDGCYSVFKRGM